MAISYDSKGNPKVDFAWGNFPMQPDAERKTSAAPVVALLAYADEKSGKQRFYTTELSADFVAGAEFEVSGFSTTGLNRKYVVESVEDLTPGGYIKTTTPYIAYEGMSSPPSNNLKATLDPSKNLGGGTGDYGWSKTTKKISEKLDLTLDGHAITQQKWNGYPGYVPNVPSLSLWEGTLPAGSFANMTTMGTVINFEFADIMSTPNGTGEQGYIIKVAEPVADEMIVSLKSLVLNDSLIGQSVDGFTAELDYMGMTGAYDLPAGHIVSASTVDDFYGNSIVFLVVYTGTLQPSPSNGIGTPGTGTLNTEPINLVIGAGNNKTLVFKGNNQDDFGSFTAFGDYSTNKFIASIETGVYGGGGFTINQELLDAASSNNLAGALIGFSFPLSPYGGQPQTMMSSPNTPYAALGVTFSEVLPNDGYGNAKVRLETTVPWNGNDMVDGFYFYKNNGYPSDPQVTMYIVK